MATTDAAPERAADIVLENARLRTQLQAQLDELAACRQRHVDAVGVARRRIERDLHDGAQGQLVALAMSLGLLEAKLPGDPHAARRIAIQAREAVAAALAQLRQLSQGLYPVVLAERGLAPALKELAGRAALPVELEMALDQRLASHIETTAYFLIGEALTNTAKHADATIARVTVRRDERRLLIEVTDNGKGGVKLGRGTGLRGLTERIQTLGGRLLITSPTGHGTTIRAEIPSR